MSLIFDVAVPPDQVPDFIDRASAALQHQHKTGNYNCLLQNVKLGHSLDGLP